MKVKVDRQKCEAHGVCVLAAPSVFALGDDDSVVTVLQEHPGEELQSQVEEAVRLCPVAAITVERE